MKTNITRRHFLEKTSLAGAGVALALPHLTGAAEAAADLPAKLGGKPACSGGWPGWPVFGAPEEQALLDTLKSGHWYRGTGKAVSSFEEAYQKLTGAKHCLATASGTAALSTTLGALEIGPGDEVIIPPYTFVATYNAVVLNYALPVFVDSDVESFQIDANQIEAAITRDTKVIMPVHMGGYPVNLDKILEVAGKHKVPVVEDACQAHLAEWRGRKVGTWGLAGCFSFQASKNLNSGEGGAVLTNDDQFGELCYNFHNQGRARQVSGYNFSYSGTRGSNLRLCEFQGGLLTAQMTRVIEQSNRRHENALYLTKLLGEIPGIKPARLHEGTTRTSRLLLMARYQKEHFANLDRSKFLAALSAEGIPCTPGYGPLNLEQNVQALAANRCYLRIYGKRTMARWVERNRCPVNDKLCAEALWFPQNVLLGSKSDMDQVAEAIRKIQAGAADIAKAG